jgi:hypothetical protein
MTIPRTWWCHRLTCFSTYRRHHGCSTLYFHVIVLNNHYVSSTMFRRRLFVAIPIQLPDSLTVKEVTVLGVYQCWAVLWFCYKLWPPVMIFF